MRFWANKKHWLPHRYRRRRGISWYFIGQIPQEIPKVRHTRIPPIVGIKITSFLMFFRLIKTLWMRRNCFSHDILDCLSVLTYSLCIWTGGREIIGCGSPFSWLEHWWVLQNAPELYLESMHAPWWCWLVINITRQHALYLYIAKGHDLTVSSSWRIMFCLSSTSVHYSNISDMVIKLLS